MSRGKPEYTERVTVRFDKRTYEGLMVNSESSNHSPSDLIRRAVRDYLKKNKEKE